MDGDKDLELKPSVQKVTTSWLMKGKLHAFVFISEVSINFTP